MASKKMTLYEINSAIMECVDLETGEILDFERLEQLNLAREQKIEGVALGIKNLQSEATSIKAEEMALAERRKAKEAEAARREEWLGKVLDGIPFETARVALGFRRSQAVEINDAFGLLEWLERNGRDDCLRYKAPEISKSEVAKLLKAGVEVPGAALIERQNLQIK